MGILPRDVYDLLSLVKAQRRRSQYRRMVSQGYDPFGANIFKGGHHGEHRVGARQVDSRTRTDTAAAMAMDLRRQISDLHAQGNLPQATGKYLELINLTDEAVLPRQQQLDIANYLMTDQRYPQAATAYEQLLKYYPTYEHAGDIRLMLGIIYGRYLKQADRAEENLRRALAELTEDTKLAMAKAELEALRR
jgi:tetratricopeptide (TPR) repeat protein